MDSTIERENLDALINSDGWRTFTDYVTSEWGPGGRAFISAVTGAANGTDSATAMAHLQQIIVAQKEIQKVLAWPEERLKALKAPDLSVIYPRRGRL